MAYEINKTNGKVLTSVPDGKLDITTSIRLIGKNYSGTPSYGEVMAENLVAILENFSNSSEPLSPMDGQVWYNSASKELLYCINPAGQLQVDRWISASSGYTNSQLSTLSVNDVNGITHKVVGHYVSGVLIAIDSNDNSFQPAPIYNNEILGITNFTFPEINTGINLTISLISGEKYGYYPIGVAKISVTPNAWTWSVSTTAEPSPLTVTPSTWSWTVLATTETPTSWEYGIGEYMVAQYTSPSTGTPTAAPTPAPPTPTYTITPSRTTYNENEVYGFTLRTTNVPSGTRFYWGVEGVSGSFIADGANINISDVSPDGGIVTINTAGTAIFGGTIRADLLTEGTEVFRAFITDMLRVRLQESASVTINDTSLTPTLSPTTPTYAMAVNKTSINEGETITFTVNTTNVPDGTIVQFGVDAGLTPSFNTANAADFGIYDYSSPLSFGSFIPLITINNNTATFNLVSTSTDAVEGTETLALVIKDRSSGSFWTSTLLARAPLVTINDPSLT